MDALQCMIIGKCSAHDKKTKKSVKAKA